MTKTDLALEFAFQTHEIDARLEILEETGLIELVQLGKFTLIIAPDAVDVQDAIAGLSDELEREWRAEKGIPMPDREDFSR